MPNSIRPYPRRLAGRATRWSFHALDARKRFELAWTEEEGCASAETILFVPELHYRGGRLEVAVSDGAWRHDAEQQTLAVTHLTGANSGSHWLTLQLLPL
mmetsp:Transcript_50852/g.119564  ORF Transcript_50852/g.119564 Transcript_50852/m.119564 type:complete len:100 (+) Transcript_50852:26-325(+)